MATLLLLTAARGSAEQVLPALELLPHEVTVAPATLSSAAGNPADIVLVDARSDLAVMRSLCQELRSVTAAPVLAVFTEGGLAALTAEWQVADFLVDGSSPAEVEARLRVAPARTAGTNVDENTISIGELVIDENGYTARIGGRVLDLTYKEFELLKQLAANPGRVFTRAQLLQEVWGYDYFGGTRTVDVHVRRLRAKLGHGHEAAIGTVRNVGYRYVPDDERDS